jgi:hypothetical protein
MKNRLRIGKLMAIAAAFGFLASCSDNSKKAIENPIVAPQENKDPKVGGQDQQKNQPQDPRESEKPEEPRFIQDIKLNNLVNLNAISLACNNGVTSDGKKAIRIVLASEHNENLLACPDNPVINELQPNEHVAYINLIAEKGKYKIAGQGAERNILKRGLYTKRPFKTFYWLEGEIEITEIDDFFVRGTMDLKFGDGSKTINGKFLSFIQLEKSSEYEKYIDAVESSLLPKNRQISLKSPEGLQIPVKIALGGLRLELKLEAMNEKDSSNKDLYIENIDSLRQNVIESYCKVPGEEYFEKLKIGVFNLDEVSLSANLTRCYYDWQNPPKKFSIKKEADKVKLEYITKAGRTYTSDWSKPSGI